MKADCRGGKYEGSMDVESMTEQVTAFYTPIDITSQKDTGYSHWDAEFDIGRMYTDLT